MNVVQGTNEQDHVPLKDESSEKTDSGMDEDMTENSPDLGSDDDDEDVITSRKVTKKKVILDDDEDEEEEQMEQENNDGGKTSEVNGGKKTVSEVLDAILNSDTEDDGPFVGQAFDNSSSEDEEKKNTIKRKKKKNLEDDSSNSDVQTQRPNLFDNDLYDAEDSDVENSGSASDRSPVVSDNEVEDEGFDDDTDPRLKAKLLKMKGAARKPKERRDRKAKPKGDDLLGLHSETQRIIRESSISIPYHHPTPKSLDDFLARASKKQQEYKALRGAKEFKKPHVIQHVLANVTPDELPRLSKSKVKVSSSSRRTKGPENILKLDDQICDKDMTANIDVLSHSTINLDTLGADVPSHQSTSTVDTAKRTLQYGSDDDELPDISMDSETNISRTLGEVSKPDSRTININSDSNDAFTGISKKGESISNSVTNSDNDKDIGAGSAEERSKVESSRVSQRDTTSDSADECSLVLRLETQNSEKENLEINTSSENHEQNMENKDAKMNNNATDEKSEKNADSETSTMNSDNENSKMNECNDRRTINSDKEDLEYRTITSNNEDHNNQSVAHQEMDVKKTPILERFSELTDIKPRLSGDPSSFINLDEDETQTPKNPGIINLIDRFLQHSKKKTNKPKKDIDISIVQKEHSDGSKDDLKMTSFTYHVDDHDEEDDVNLDTPGAKLLKLKDQLKVQIKVKREEARQKRVELYELENEEGFAGEDEEEAMLDNEDELSDKTDTDVEDNEFEEQFGNEDEDEEQDENPFADEEAEDDDNNDDGEDSTDDDSDENTDLPDTMKLRLDSSDDEEHSHENAVKKKKLRKLAISDDEESQQSAPGEKEAKKTESTADDARPFSSVTSKDHNDDTLDGLSPLSKHLSATQTQKPRKRSSLTLPIEDSQDLYDDTQTESLSMAGLPSKASMSNDSLNFLLDDSQSQMLDADGFLKVNTSLRKPSKESLSFIDETSHVSSTQNNMDELLGLCSGKFVETQEEGKKVSCKNLFGGSTKSTTGDMDELLGLCSGFFPASCPDGNKDGASGNAKRKATDEEQSNTSFNLLSDGEDNLDSEKELSDDDDQRTDDNSDDTEELPDVQVRSKKKHFKGFVASKTKKIRQAFVEEEAELSGSEYDSDENLDIPEEDDIMEMEEGDLDNSISEEELRDQVGRVHLKRTIDEDKRDIMRLQEMYLPDGDLYSDGKGRTRRFKWSNQDEESQEDMFGNGSDDEGPEEENADELKWRMERFEREKFLEEQREKEQENEDGSQLLKLGKMFLLRQVSTEKKETEFKKPLQPNKSPVKVFKPSIARKGSFLTRSKAALAQISARSKVTVNPTGPTNSKNFIFQVVSPDKVQDKSEPASKSAIATKKRKSAIQNPPSKRPRPDSKSPKRHKSIFNLLER
ncbi:claspin-like [Gigantopelta aegis]|uniref:claspin-like n=1 Tax=Gigantopelta aegis TaxID=1735272 RepID=UPI001B88D2DB|nr:claspin-like [Gigantopelta aegis]